MSFFQRPHYESDVTQFILKLKEQKPQIEAGQRQGRDLLWDKDVDLDADRPHCAESHLYDPRRDRGAKRSGEPRPTGS